MKGQFSVAQQWVVHPDTALPRSCPCRIRIAAGIFFSPFLPVFQQRPWHLLSLTCWADSFWVSSLREVQVSVDRREAAQGLIKQESVGIYVCREAISAGSPWRGKDSGPGCPHVPAWGPQNGRSALRRPPPRCYATGRARPPPASSRKLQLPGSPQGKNYNSQHAPRASGRAP